MENHIPFSHQWKEVSQMIDRCICCGAEIPEGRQVCLKCEDVCSRCPYEDTGKCDSCLKRDKMGKTLKEILDREDKRIKG
jgi:hypothetical protein